MTDFNRRTFIAGLALTSQLSMPNSGFAQNKPPVAARFEFEDVVRRAHEIANMPFLNTATTLPEPIVTLDFDAWRDIRFRSEKAFLNTPGSNFRLQPFHLGHLFRQSVTINIIHEGIATPIPYSNSLFDYGRTKIDRPLPINLGFAGFRLHYPLNQPGRFDELTAFLGASYFRFLGRGQRYGLSCRGVAVNAGTKAEEFPFFREFWIETPEADATHISIFALLDGESVTGAYRFDIFPEIETRMEVNSTLFPRRPGIKLGLAPLTSMYFKGENELINDQDFRPELHDSDGLLMHSGTGEWLWRPLRNPPTPELSAFADKNIRGYGLMQRDRNFEHYQDLDLAYELRPSYWVEPRDNWGEGNIELFELPTVDESNDNIVASFVSRDIFDPGRPIALGYRITSYLEIAKFPPAGRVINTFQTQPHALGSNEPQMGNARRFIIDFAEGDLRYYLAEPQDVEVVPTATAGKILRAFVTPNNHIGGFRATLDVQCEPGQSTDLRAYLKAGNRALTETWTLPWKAPG